MTNIYRTQDSQPGFTFDVATGEIRNSHGATVQLSAKACAELAFTLELLEKYEDTEIGRRATRFAIVTAFSFLEV